MTRTTQQHSKSGNAGRESEIIRRTGEALLLVLNRELDTLTRVLVRLFIPQCHSRQLPRFGRIRKLGTLAILFGRGRFCTGILILHSLRCNECRGNSTGWLDLVDRRHGVARTNFARIFAIVSEIFRLQHSIFVTNQTIALYLSRIEFDLNLHVFGDRHQRARQLLNQHSVSFAVAVDVGVMTVAVVRQFFQFSVL